MGWGNTYLANVAAAEYFVKRRMDGSHRDLVSLVQFGGEAYIVTPFTNDYENILLEHRSDRAPPRNTTGFRTTGR